MPDLPSGDDLVRIKTPEGCEVVAPASHWLKCFAAYTMGVQADAALLEALKTIRRSCPGWPHLLPNSVVMKVDSAIAKAQEVNRG